MATDVYIHNAHLPTYRVGERIRLLAALLLLATQSHQYYGAPPYPISPTPTLFVNNVNVLSSVTPVKTIVSDVPSSSINLCIHPSRLLREPPAIKNQMGVDMMH